MTDSTMIWIYSLLLIQLVLSDGSIDKKDSQSKVKNNLNNKCTTECMRKVSIGSNSVDTGDSCARGCRFFTLAQLIEKKEYYGKLIITDACKAMCQESYGDSGFDSTSCRTGCESSNTYSAPIVAEFSWSWFIDSGNTIQVIQGDIPEPDDVLTDPSLRSQITRVETLRIPEIRLRTMPILQDKNIQMEGGPTLCTGVSVRGIQSCLVWSLLLLLTLVGLWSCVGEVRDHQNIPPPILHPIK